MRIIYLIDDTVRTTDVVRFTDLARAMQSRGHHVTIFLDKALATLADDLTRKGTECRVAGFGGLRIGLSIKLTGLLADADRCVIAASSWRSAATAITAARQYVAKGRCIHTVVDLSCGSLLRALDPAGKRKMLSGLSAVVVPLTVLRDRLAGAIPWLDPRRIHVHSPGVPLLDVADTITPPADAMPIDHKEPLRLLFAGRLLEHCGLGNVLEGMRMAFDVPVTLTVAGQGPGRYAMPLVRIVRALNLTDRVRWMGGDPIPSPEMLAEANAAVLPAPGIVDDPLQLEAIYMSASLPVIVPQTSTLPSPVLNGVDGMTVSQSDSPEAWAEVFRTLHTQPELLRQLSADARQKALAQYDFTTLVDSTERLYSALLNESSI